MNEYCVSCVSVRETPLVASLAALFSRSHELSLTTHVSLLSKHEFKGCNVLFYMYQLYEI